MFVNKIYIDCKNGEQFTFKAKYKKRLYVLFDDEETTIFVVKNNEHPIQIFNINNLKIEKVKFFVN